jgi:hypothetical protein
MVDMCLEIGMDMGYLHHKKKGWNTDPNMWDGKFHPCFKKKK